MQRLDSFRASFRHASRGMTYLIKHEKNFQNELGITFLVILAMIYFDVSWGEKIVLIFVITGVLVMELFNTVVERMVDILKPRVHPYARLIKDLMAAGVLITSIFALIIGIIIFLPYFYQMYKN